MTTEMIACFNAGILKKTVCGADIVNKPSVAGDHDKHDGTFISLEIASPNISFQSSVCVAPRSCYMILCH